MTEKTLKQILIFKKDHKEALFALSSLFDSEQRYSDSSKVLDKLIYYYPFDVTGHFLKAKILTKLAYFSKAFQALKYPLKIEPENQEFLLYQALNLCFLDGDSPKRKLILKKTKELKTSEHYYIKATCLIALNRDEKAKTMFKKGQDLDPTNLDGLANYGKMLYLMDKTDEALQILKNLLERSVKKDFILNNIGQIYFSRKNYFEAEGYYLNSLEMEPDCKQAYCDLASIYDKLSKYQEGHDIMRKAIENFPEEADYYFKLSWFLGHLKRIKEIPEFLSKAIKLKPKDKTFNIAMFHIQINLNEFEKARSVLDSLFKEDLNDPIALDLQSRLFLYLKTEKETVEYCENLLKNPNENWNWVYSALAISLNKLGRYEEALQYIDKFLEEHSDEKSVSIKKSILENIEKGKN